MSVQPVTTPTSHHYAVNQHTTTTASTPSSGIVGVNSSVNSSCYFRLRHERLLQHRKVSARKSALGYLKRCLQSDPQLSRKAFPLIGGWFGGSSCSTSIVNIPAPPAPTIDPAAARDATLVNILREIYKPAPAAATSAGSTVPAPAVPNAGTIRNFAKDHFRAIQSPAEKIAAFQAVQTAQNSNDEITRQFFDALDEGAGGNAIEASNAGTV